MKSFENISMLLQVQWKQFSRELRIRILLEKLESNRTPEEMCMLIGYLINSIQFHMGK